MSQSAAIVAFLLAGFVLYLAAKGRLSTYTNVLWGPTTAPAQSSGGGSSGGGIFSGLGKLIGGASKLVTTGETVAAVAG
jgi:hypothetical protein